MKATTWRKKFGTLCKVKAAMATRHGFTTATSAAKRGITDWHHQSLGKNNYIKSLIREIITTARRHQTKQIARVTKNR